MKRLLVIGIGSIIMSDDGIGSKVAEAIGDKLSKNNIITIVGETDFQSCFDEINSDDYLVIIDAMAQGELPGSIYMIQLGDALKNKSKLRTQHEFSLLDLIELYYPDIKGYLIGIEVAEIGYGFELSNPLQQSFEQICTTVVTMIINIKEKIGNA